MLKICQICKIEYEAPRKDRRFCTSECKRIFKRAYDVTRYPTHALKKIESSKAWYADNSGRKQAYDVEYRALNRGRRLQLKPDYYLKTKDTLEVKLSRRLSVYKRRKTLIFNGIYSVSVADLLSLYTQYNRSCAYCNKLTHISEIHFDHVVPVSRGGRHSIGNLLPSCKSCNLSKTNKFITEWRIGRIAPRLRRHQEIL